VSTYQLLPISQDHHPFAFWENGFTTDEITLIRNFGDNKISLSDQPIATVGTGQVDNTIRSSSVTWIRSDEMMWLYDKLGYIARALNSQFFKFDLYGFNEDLQYTQYDSSQEGHYDWHVDIGPSRDHSPQRKMSLVLQLSSPDEYEGGSLELLMGAKPEETKKQMGVVYAFPSYTLHHVTRVTSGIRRSLVVWLCGAPFR
jgi:PKHD-type hydroxylase